jgi:hypothetical protein
MLALPTLHNSVVSQVKLKDLCLFYSRDDDGHCLGAWWHKTFALRSFNFFQETSMIMEAIAFLDPPSSKLPPANFEGYSLA